MQQALSRLGENQDLTPDEMTEAIATIMAGDATQAQIGAFLMGLKLKGETAAEISAAAKYIRGLAVPVNVIGNFIVDIVGTGGDNSGLFNVSTCAAFVAAGAGCTVAKHGNRSISSKSGSADLFETIGINLDLEPEQIEACIKTANIGFMFAPKHHLSFVHTIDPRRELGVKTLFNLLGPLVNPGNVKNQLIGVYDKRWVVPFAKALKSMGSEHAMIVHSEDGLDEISIAAPTYFAELKSGHIKTGTLKPEDFGIAPSKLELLRVENPQQSWELIQQVFNNKAGAAFDMVALNAGTAIYISGLAKSIPEGINKAKQAIAEGHALSKVKELLKLAPLDPL